MMTEKRKLMLLSPMLHQGGFERVCVTTARLLEPYFDVTIVIFDSAEIAYNVEGLKIVDLNLGVQQGKVRKLLNMGKRSRRVRAIKKQLKPDIAYSFGPTANLVNAFSKTRETKVWLGIRSYMDLEEDGKLKIFTRLADLLVCCSKEIEKEIKIKYKFNKTCVLYNPYDVESIKREADSKEPLLPWPEEADGRRRILVSMGRDDEIKGFWHMLKSFDLAAEKCPEIKLMILGDGSFAKEKALAKELGIADKVYFAGMQKEPYPYLKQGDIYLLTSYHEGFPNALVEGMALGLAPVSTNCRSGPGEILMEDPDGKGTESSTDKKTSVIYGDYGILLPVMKKERPYSGAEVEPEERILAEVIVKLMKDESLLKKYQKAALERAKIFTYEGYVQQFLNLAGISDIHGLSCDCRQNVL